MSQLNTIPEAIEAIRRGEIIIVVDDEDRENEGDFLIAARHASPEVINFMATHGRGLICALFWKTVATNWAWNDGGKQQRGVRNAIHGVGGSDGPWMHHGNFRVGSLENDPRID